MINTKALLGTITGLALAAPISAGITTAATAGTLGYCGSGYNNPTTRCFLDTNKDGVFQAHEPYFPGGEVQARQQCFDRGSLYISGLGESDQCVIR